MSAADHLCAARHLPSWIFALVVTLSVLAGDLVSKSLAFKYMADQPVNLSGDPITIPNHPPIVCIPHLLALKLTVNEGAVFGLGQGRQWFFVVASVVAVVVLGRIFWRSRAGQWSMHLPLALILAGAMGNLVDRIHFGVVRDFLWMFPQVHLPFNWRWPGGNSELFPWIFNVADSALVCGVVLMLIWLWRSERHQRDERKAPD